ncbi:MAG: hypothetical protein F4Y87_05510 [Synechococcus sp. SB0665_bin_28]|nr:hypothetical protein [Synechococcus sp. SB0665_bin_28]MYF19965.1 hypothetical protein [Synechococcus sp. SB0677_bin_5]
MPLSPPDSAIGFAPSVFLAMLGLILGLQGKRIDEQGKRIGELRAEFKADNRALNEKLDRLIEALLTTKQP